MNRIRHLIVENQGAALLEAVLVRHGETQWSKSLKHTSATDVELTEEGESAALALAPRLAGDYSAVLTSPRTRALRTAHLAGFGQPAVDEDLAEWDYGDMEGLTTAQVREHISNWSVWTHECPGGESLTQVAARADRVIARLGVLEGRVLIFSHGHMLRILAARWLGLPPIGGSLFALDTGSVSRLGYERERPVLRSWNC